MNTLVNEKTAEGFVIFLRQFVTLTDVEVRKEVLPLIHLRRFRKKEIVTAAGEVENYINFINDGLVRKYYKQGEEENRVQLSLEGHLIASQESFYTRTPSEYFVETIEASIVLSVAHEDMERIFRSNHNMERLWEGWLFFIQWYRKISGTRV